MVVIRLARRGTTHRPKYRITVADQRFSLGGRYLEVLGNYDPFAQGKAKSLSLDMAKYEAWVKKGAQPTNRVKSLVKKMASV